MPTTAADQIQKLQKSADFYFRSGQFQRANECYWKLLELGIDDETRRAVEERLNEIAGRTGAIVDHAVAEDGEGPGVGGPAYAATCLGQAAMVVLCLWQAIQAVRRHGVGGCLEPLVAAALFAGIGLGLLSMRGRVAGSWRRVAAAANVFAGGMVASATVWFLPQIDVVVRDPSRDTVLALAVLAGLGALVFFTHKALRAGEVFDPPGWMWWATPLAAIGAVVSDASFRFWLSLRFGGNSPEQMFASALQAAMSAAGGAARTDLLLVVVWMPIAIAGFFRGR